jgi:hypothetical protein
LSKQIEQDAQIGLDLYDNTVMKRAVLLLALAATVTVFAAYLAPSRMTLNGQTVSTNVIERDGVAYVPIKDVAAALKMNISKTSSSYDLSPTGGANQINGLNGKVGDVLFNGYARFQVVSVSHEATHTNLFTSGHENISPSPGNEFVIVVCRIKNGTNDTVTCLLPGAQETALTDSNGRSYGMKTGDIDVPTNGVHLLPGAAADFAITFDVPTGLTIQDLVYQARFYGTKAEDKKFRISLGN